VWEKELRGLPLQVHEAAFAYCLRQHVEWRDYWNNLNTHSGDSPKLNNILIHIYNDAAVKLQLDTKNPPEIHALYQSLRGGGFSELDSLHQIAFILQEVSW